MNIIIGLPYIEYSSFYFHIQRLIASFKSIPLPKRPKSSSPSVKNHLQVPLYMHDLFTHHYGLLVFIGISLFISFFFFFLVKPKTIVHFSKLVDYFPAKPRRVLCMFQCVPTWTRRFSSRVCERLKSIYESRNGANEYPPIMNFAAVQTSC